jgi:hypothetical protein
MSFSFQGLLLSYSGVRRTHYTSQYAGGGGGALAAGYALGYTETGVAVGYAAPPPLPAAETVDTETGVAVGYGVYVSDALPPYAGTTTGALAAANIEAPAAAALFASWGCAATATTGVATMRGDAGAAATMMRAATGAAATGTRTLWPPHIP